MSRHSITSVSSAIGEGSAVNRSFLAPFKSVKGSAVASVAATVDDEEWEEECRQEVGLSNEKTENEKRKQVERRQRSSQDRSNGEGLPSLTEEAVSTSRKGSTYLTADDQRRREGAGEHPSFSNDSFQSFIASPPRSPPRPREQSTRRTDSLEEAQSLSGEQTTAKCLAAPRTDDDFVVGKGGTARGIGSTLTLLLSRVYLFCSPLFLVFPLCIL